MKHIPVTLRLFGVAAVSIGLYACFGTDSGAPKDDDLSKLGAVPLGAGGNCASDYLLQAWYTDTCTCNWAYGSTTCQKRYTAGINEGEPSGNWQRCGWVGENSQQTRCTDVGQVECLPSCGTASALGAGIQCNNSNNDTPGECWGYYENISGVKGRCGWHNGTCWKLGVCGP